MLFAHYFFETIRQPWTGLHGDGGAAVAEMTGKWETLAGESPGRLVTQGQRLRAEFTGTMVALHRSSGSRQSGRGSVSCPEPVYPPHLCLLILLWNGLTLMARGNHHPDHLLAGGLGFPSHKQG